MDALRGAGVEDPRLDAELLLAEATGWPRERFATDPDDPLPTGASRRFAQMVRRRVRREPVAYILGRKGFRGIELAVDPRVLIPRPETELLVEVALELAPATVLDVGTGSGAVALAIADDLGAIAVIAVFYTEDIDLAWLAAAAGLLALTFALGMYLPLTLSAAIVAGGLVAEAVRRRTARKSGPTIGTSREGILCAAGLVTGEALMGIGLALPVAASSIWPAISSDPFALFERPPLGATPGGAVFVLVAIWLFRAAQPRQEGGRDPG